MSAANVQKGGILPNAQRLHQAEAFQASQFANWKKNFKTLQINPPSTGMPFNPQWVGNLPDAPRIAMLTNMVKSRIALNRMYPYTHVLEDEQKYNIQKNYVDQNGVARSYGSNDPMGKVMVGSEFFDYANAAYNRDLAGEFDTFVMNNMDLTDLVKKEYWKNKLPGYYEKVMKGVEMKMEDDFKASRILLRGPQDDEEWLFLYRYYVNPTELNTPTMINPPNRPKTPLPPKFDLFENYLNTAITMVGPQNYVSPPVSSASQVARLDTSASVPDPGFPAPLPRTQFLLGKK